MNDLFIEYDECPYNANLGADYRALQSAVAQATSRLAELKSRRGQRVSREHPDEQLKRERGRVYEVTLIRLSLEAGRMFAAVRKLMASKETLASNLERLAGNDMQRRALSQNNLICADQLCDAALDLYYSFRREENLDHIAHYYFDIGAVFKQLDNKPNPREFVVMASGHGSAFRYDGGDGKTPPPPPYMTLEEAKAEARHWEGIADTIGGSAQVVNVKTGQAVPHY